MIFFIEYFLLALCRNYRVERFMLIATTGKNAKTRKIRFSVNQSSHLLFNTKL